ncbi:MAG TPA: SH3 domain-containing protein [Flavisolibacter sp.]|nr:SH3 domain-containing protein [Flavisolibacter sp.]
MALQNKYAELVTAAKNSGVQDLQVREQGNVLYINGNAPTGAVKDNLWNIYNKIDPDFRAADLVLDINVTAATGTKATVTTKESNLNIRKGPGTEQPIVGKAAHNDTVTVLNQTNQQWWLVKTNAGVEGYAYSQYLKPE